MSGRASSEPSPRIEQLAPELEKILSPSQTIEHLADGFGGPLGPAEGPLWWKEGGYLLFSDIHNNKRLKYEPGKGVSLFLEPTNRANGLTRDLQGRLLACEHDSRRVTRIELDGSTTVGVTCGASVPEDLVAGVLDWLAAAGFGDVEEVETIREGTVFALPHELRKSGPSPRRNRS